MSTLLAVKKIPRPLLRHPWRWEAWHGDEDCMSIGFDDSFLPLAHRTGVSRFFLFRHIQTSSLIRDDYQPTGIQACRAAHNYHTLS